MQSIAVGATLFFACRTSSTTTHISQAGMRLRRFHGTARGAALRWWTMSKRKVKLFLVNDCGGEREEAWNEPVIAFDNQDDAEVCACAREPRQSIWNEGFGYRDYSGSFVTEIDAVIDDSILEPRNTRGHVQAVSDRPWYQVPGHSLSGLPLSLSKTFEGTDYE